MNDKNTTYLYAAITDSQGTVRAIDFKVSVLMLILTIPMTQMPAIYATISSVLSKAGGSCCLMVSICGLLVAVFILAWAVSFLAGLRALIAIDNPAIHIPGAKPKGTFYGGDLFTVGFADALFNRGIKAKHSVEEQQKHLPETDEALVAELTFEQMKLAYIRSIKIVRQKFAFIFSVIWLLSGGAIWLISKIIK